MKSVDSRTNRVPIRQLWVPADYVSHSLPTDIAAAWVAREIDVVRAMERWARRLSEDELGDEMWVEIERLAGSIAASGQMTPIVVTTHRQIISGVRRTLAHGLLVLWGKEEFATISAIITDQSWTLEQQLAETFARSGLTAVETAINLGRAVAQVQQKPVNADGMYVATDAILHVPSELREVAMDRVGYGVWRDRLQPALGLTGERMKQFLRILRLCDEALTIAHRAGLGEASLREVVRYAQSPEEQVRQVRRLAARKTGRPDPSDDETVVLDPPPPVTLRTVLEAIERLSDACQHLVDLYDDGLNDLVVEAFNTLTAEEFEDRYEPIDRLRNLLSPLRGQQFRGLLGRGQHDDDLLAEEDGLDEDVLDDDVGFDLGYATH